MSKMCAGIDYSMSCPAICIHPIKPIKKFNECRVFFYTDKPKYQAVFEKTIFGMRMIPYDSQIERFDNISEWAMAILNKYSVTDVCLEGYSMGSKGVVFNIGENTGILKHKMWLAGMNVITPSPNTIKKHFTGSGAAKKEAMLDTFNQRFDTDLRKTLSYTAKNIESPIGDVVDSVAMADYLISNF